MVVSIIAGQIVISWLYFFMWFGMVMVIVDLLTPKYPY